MDLYIGMMSGTSLDGVDAVLVDFAQPLPQLLGFLHVDFSDTLQAHLRLMSTSQTASLQMLGEAHTALGECYAEIVALLLQETQCETAAIQAIGNHGQTLFHHPEAPHPFTLQIGNHAVLAARSKIPVVGDFRSLDMAYGGQGAPLAPLFHQAYFAQPGKNIALLNLGGIANVTILNGSRIIAGFDTGPANGLMDEWMQQHHGKPFDENGTEARNSIVDSTLLTRLLSDPYFAKIPPKSTGREYFNLARLPQNISIATLAELTVQSIQAALKPYAPDEIWACGGGAFNLYLLERLGARSIAEKGWHPQAIEPLAFAWLAKMRLAQYRFDLRSITGSTQPTLLGQIFQF